ncbi:MAG: hypothetical protein ABSG98_13150 [Anaerolineales bacterium]
MTQFLGYYPGNFPRLRVPVGRQLGIQQPGVQAHLKPTSVRRHQADAGNLRLVLAEQFGRQTDGPVGVVSNRAIDYLDFVHVLLLCQPDLRASISWGAGGSPHAVDP